MSAKNKSNELKLSRLYDAPVKLVWDAWTDPKHVAQWWGPRGFTITTHSKDLRVGGSWNYTMHGPDGVDYPNTTFYHEVEKYSRLVYDHGASEDRPPLFRVTVTFQEIKGKTQMDMTMTFASPEVAEQSRKFIKSAGGESTWDRLAEYLDKEISNKDKFVINRSFNAPLELMFKVWTDPKHLGVWTAPTGFNTHFIRAEVKPGGSSFYYMSNDQGLKMYGRTSYLEIERPNRIVYTQQFVDENEKVTRHPMSPTWPETMLTTVVFTAESSNQTRVTLTWEPYGSYNAEEIQTFINARAGMTGGWTGSFDKLEDYLAAQVD